MNEVFYKKTQHGSFTIYVRNIIERMMTVNDISTILDKTPYEAMGYFQNMYNADVIDSWGRFYLYFKKEKQAKRAIEYINGMILTNKMMGA